MSTSLLSKPFTDGLAQGVLRYQRCERCGAAQRLARYACTACGESTLGWHDAAGTGCVFSLTEVKRAPTDAFKAMAPYTLVLVDERGEVELPTGHKLTLARELVRQIASRLPTSPA
jgi:uncharacterized OB-fold protein